MQRTEHVTNAKGAGPVQMTETGTETETEILGSGVGRGFGANPPETPTPEPPSIAIEAAVRRLGGVLGQTWDAGKIDALGAELGTDRLLAVVSAAKRDPWYQAKPERFRGDVIFGGTQLGILLAKTSPKPGPRAPAPTPARSTGTIAGLRVGDTAEGGRCAWCNEPQTFAWDGADYAPDPRHQACRDAARRHT